MLYYVTLHHFVICCALLCVVMYCYVVLRVVIYIYIYIYIYILRIVVMLRNDVLLYPSYLTRKPASIVKSTGSIWNPS